jgi:hypothetical protein
MDSLLTMDAMNPLFVLRLGALPPPILATMTLMNELESGGDEEAYGIGLPEYADLDLPLEAITIDSLPTGGAED